MTSELDLIGRIAAIATRRAGVSVGIGDDAAVLDTSPPTVVALDVVVDGVHFRRSTSAPADIGHRALAVNLSDLAAMGARPVAAFLGLTLPSGAPLAAADIEELVVAMEALAGAHAMTIAGGDVTTGPALSLAVTVTGLMPRGVAPVLRSGARPGDVLCVTGTLGAAAAGLLVLEDPVLATGVAAADALRAAARRPVPRVAAGMALAAAGASAMLDCSDGLALDTARMAAASGVAIAIDLEAVPLGDGVAQVAAAAGREADLLGATGGEDYELIVALSPEVLTRARDALDVALVEVGRVVTGPPGLTLTRGGAVVRPPSLGWEHRTADRPG